MVGAVSFDVQRDDARRAVVVRVVKQQQVYPGALARIDTEVHPALRYARAEGKTATTRNLNHGTPPSTSDFSRGSLPFLPASPIV
jgi:hypothetical protein